MIRRTLERVPWLETTILVVAFAFITALTLFGQGTKPAEQFESYSTYDAAGGGYRAFYELVAREGYKVDRFEQELSFLDPAIGTLVYAEPSAKDPSARGSGEAEASDLDAWIKAGGTFVYFGHDEDAAKKKIIGQPYTHKAAAKAHASHEAASLQSAGVGSLGAAAGTLRFTPAGKIHTLYDDGRGPVTIVYPYGKGTVVETVDETFLDNAKLGTADRARFAMALLAMASWRGTVWFDEAVHGHLAPVNWYDVVPRGFIYAMIVATIAMLIAIAGASIRLGPAIVPKPRDDRTSADFIEALSTLFERGKAADHAVADAVRSTSRAVARSVGLAGDPAGAEIAARIIEPERRAAFEGMLAGAAVVPQDSATFLRTIALAQRLRKDSVPHGR